MILIFYSVIFCASYNDFSKCTSQIQTNNSKESQLLLQCVNDKMLMKFKEDINDIFSIEYSNLKTFLKDNFETSYDKIEFVDLLIDNLCIPIDEIWQKFDTDFNIFIKIDRKHNVDICRESYFEKKSDNLISLTSNKNDEAGFPKYSTKKDLPQLIELHLQNINVKSSENRILLPILEEKFDMYNILQNLQKLLVKHISDNSEYLMYEFKYTFFRTNQTDFLKAKNYLKTVNDKMTSLINNAITTF